MFNFVKLYFFALSEPDPFFFSSLGRSKTALLVRRIVCKLFESILLFSL
jgi:hypothetical protein